MVNWRFWRRGTDATVTTTALASYTMNQAFARFKPKLVLYRKDNIENWRHREDNARYDPIANFITYKVARVAFDDWFHFVDKDGNPLEEMKQVEERLHELHFNQVLIDACRYARIHGWSIILAYDRATKGPEDMQNVLLSWENVARLEAFAGERDVQVDRVYESGPKMGLPEVYRISVAVEKSAKPIDILIHESHVVHVNPEPVDRSYKGATALDPVWDDIVMYRQLSNSAVWYGAKYGGKTFIVKPSEGTIGNRTISEAEKTLLEEQLKQFDMRNALVLPDSKYEVQAEGGGGAIDYYSMTEILLDRIAAGCGIPKDYLKGVSAGAVTGSEQNEKEFFSTISGVQDQYEPIIREVISRLFPSLTTEYYFDWANEQNLNSREEAELQNLTEDAVNKKLSYMTVNEVREQMGLPPVPEGNIIPALKPLMSFGISPETTSTTSSSENEEEGPPQETQEEEPPETGQSTDAQTRFLTRVEQRYGLRFKRVGDAVAYALAQEGSINRLCKTFQIGRSSYYRWTQDAFQITPENQLVGEAVVARAGVYEYPELAPEGPVRQLKSPEELAKAVKLTPTVPIIFNHVTPGEETAAEWVGTAYLRYEDSAVKARCVFDAERIPDWLAATLQDGRPIPVSAGFTYDYGPSGTWQGQRFDALQQNILFKHVGVIVDPNMEPRKTPREGVGLNLDAVKATDPFAGFRDFQDCVNKMLEKGHTEEEAKKICGKLQAEHEGERSPKQSAGDGQGTGGEE